MLGETVGRRYRLVHKLGRGSRADVYLSRTEDTGEIFTVKVFGIVDAPPEILERFGEELSRMGPRWEAIDDPHVARVYDYGWNKSTRTPFLVTEYIPGCTLLALLKHTPMLPIPTALAIGYQVALGLAAAHAQDVVHGNLQPHQVFITPKGTIKVTDFGLAHLADICSWSSAELWPPTTWLFYVTEEQVIGRDLAGDAYALGSLLHHLLLGDVPFADYDLSSLPQAIQSTGPDLMTAARPGIPAEVDELVRRCMGRSLGEEMIQLTPAEAAETIRGLLTVQPATEAEIAAALASLLTIEERAPTEVEASLYIVQQDQRVPLDQMETMIGRRDPTRQIFPDIDLIDLDPKRVLHREHAEVYPEETGWFIRALHRDARLRVNDSAVRYGRPQALSDGDRITLSGSVDLIFELR